jgi:hypothetical protein
MGRTAPPGVAMGRTGRLIKVSIRSEFDYCDTSIKIREAAARRRRSCQGGAIKE